jgi:hypothetical protein
VTIWRKSVRRLLATPIYRFHPPPSIFIWRCGCLALAKLRPDGFAGYAVSDPSQAAYLITEERDFDGGAVRLSADVEGEDSIDVVALNEEQAQNGKGRTGQRNLHRNSASLGPGTSSWRLSSRTFPCCWRVGCARILRAVSGISWQRRSILLERWTLQASVQRLDNFGYFVTHTYTHTHSTTHTQALTQAHTHRPVAS